MEYVLIKKKKKSLMEYAKLCHTPQRFDKC
jgi:hypothetical protein